MCGISLFKIGALFELVNAGGVLVRMAREFRGYITQGGFGKAAVAGIVGGIAAIGAAAVVGSMHISDCQKWQNLSLFKPFTSFRC